MKRVNLEDKLKDKKYDTGFDINDYLTSKVLNLEIDQPDIINFQETANTLNNQVYDSRNILSSSLNKLEFDNGLDAKFMHRKKREGD